jgi:ABC-type bacteriocin/lantibiotic exporter with double-glycine peptidase domain
MKAGGSTVAVVAHQLSLMAYIDQVLILSQGQMQLNLSPRQPWELLLPNRNITARSIDRLRYLLCGLSRRARAGSD